MILKAKNDRLLCKVFPANLRGPALAGLHKLLRNSINSFSELWMAFVSQYLCSVRQKRSISSLYTIFKQEGESIRDFTRKFRHAVQQIESYSMDVVLQNFKRSFGPTMPFFQSLSLKPPVTMEELYRRAHRYSALEDHIWVVTQIVMIITQSTEKDKPAGKVPFASKEGQKEDRKRPRNQKKRDPLQFTP